MSAPLTLPSSGLVATVSADLTRIAVSWPAVAGASSYDLQRRAGSEWHTIATVDQASYTDANVAAGRTYAYRVTLGGSFTNADVATTAQFASAAARQPITANGADEMLRAVNKVREAAGWPAVTWTAILSPSDPVVAVANQVTARQLLSCRARMNEARQALGVSAVAFTDSDPALVPIKALHFNEVLQGAQ
jgi:hypothetical protein